MDVDLEQLDVEDNHPLGFPLVAEKGELRGKPESPLLSEAPGPVNFTQMVMLFAEKMAGGTRLR